ncbi:long-chain-fatty-acid--CoA ligase [Tengunoibacter tsumagoiensis]|uniref:Long-chain-fatty-acid--CoA ligase n=1 Tax=Tengunoibacter tsumagoiensis TaxID=2014871 RepID=A0A401ZWM1_9CHLR|nr:long-chain fatty acid--CoA ligase [Tengunoibacter tsumagoiensis]GCE11206.1 long-chain-fatty-acid--CoA ligase [Tengunoibacter tsumagoiensis]
MSDQSQSLIHHQHIDESQATTPEVVSPPYPWIRHYQEGVPAHLLIPDRPLTWLLDSAARRFPNRPAFIYYGTQISYAQFSHLANRFAIALQRLGIQKGDRVAIALPNIPQFGIAFYGALRAGAVVVPTNPLYTEREMQHQLTDSGAKVLVLLDMYYPVVRTIRSQTHLKHVIVTSVTDFFPVLQRTLYPLTQLHAKKLEPVLTTREINADPSLSTMQSLLKSGTRGGVELFHLPVPQDTNDLAVLQYTGGTTGLSKGAMLTHRNLLANAMQTFYWMPHARPGQEIALCIAPFFHAYGLTVGMNLSILGGAAMVLLPRFQGKEALAAIHHYQPTLFPGIPTLYVAILREAAHHPEYLGSIKYCISGASPLPSKVQQDFEGVTHGKLVEGYGLSEASPVTHCNPLSDENRPGSIGLPLPNIEAKVLNRETGEEQPVGELGELVVKGPNIMLGYWEREQETQAIFQDGWMRTGDIARVDEDGYFYIVERVKDMIIASGFNVYPREVEDVLFHHPAVQDIAVVGVPDAYRGETVAAFVVLKPEYTAGEEIKQELITYCKQNMAAYKVPKVLHFLPKLPRSTVGKVLRRELRIQNI